MDCKFKYIEVRSFEAEEVVERINVSDMTERQIDKVERGMNINLNHKSYYTQVTESEEQLTSKD